MILWITHEYTADALCRDFPSRGQGIIGRFLKFAGCIHNHKILRVNIFGLILKNKMATTVGTGVFRLSARSFVGPLEQRVLYLEISNLRICSSLQNLD